MNEYNNKKKKQKFPEDINSKYTYLNQNYSLLNQNFIHLKNDYDYLLKEKNDLNDFYQSEIRKYTNIIKDLKSQNEILNEKLIEQSNLYKALLSEFSSQQLLVENKTLKVNSLIEKTNHLLEELTNLHEINLSLEEEVLKLQNKQRIDENNKLRKYRNQIENLKIDKKLLLKENKNLSKLWIDLKGGISNREPNKSRNIPDIEESRINSSYIYQRRRHKTIEKLSNLCRKFQGHNSMKDINN